MSGTALFIGTLASYSTWVKRSPLMILFIWLIFQRLLQVRLEEKKNL